MGPPANPAGEPTSELVRAQHTLGSATRLLVLSDGICRFDGGAMFGVVPKPLWSRVAQADEANRVSIGLNTVVVQTQQRDKVRTVVIETGFGEKLPPKIAAIYGAQARLLDAFAEADIPLASVDAVINTHLHWDHCGWNTRFSADGPGIEPMFPNAQYFAHGGEIMHGRARHERDAISYVPENYEPLLASGQMEPLNIREGEEREILPGIAVELFPGHTRQLMAVHIRDQASGARACYISDLVPTVAHLPLTWGMGFDLDPMRNIAEKKRFYQRAIAEDWLVLFTHEPRTPLGYLEATPNGARLRG
jgi:glyoxylase-like metal-dependent hydrolase (beta-lactamase superfamily II)